MTQSRAAQLLCSVCEFIDLFSENSQRRKSFKMLHSCPVELLMIRCVCVIEEKQTKQTWMTCIRVSSLHDSASDSRGSVFWSSALSGCKHLPLSISAVQPESRGSCVTDILCCLVYFCWTWSSPPTTDPRSLEAASSIWAAPLSETRRSSSWSICSQPTSSDVWCWDGILHPGLQCIPDLSGVSVGGWSKSSRGLSKVSQCLQCSR